MGWGKWAQFLSIVEKGKWRVEKDVYIVPLTEENFSIPIVSILKVWVQYDGGNKPKSGSKGEIAQ